MPAYIKNQVLEPHDHLRQALLWDQASMPSVSQRLSFCCALQCGTLHISVFLSKQPQIFFSPGPDDVMEFKNYIQKDNLKLVSFSAILASSLSRNRTWWTLQKLINLLQIGSRLGMTGNHPQPLTLLSKSGSSDNPWVAVEAFYLTMSQ